MKGLSAVSVRQYENAREAARRYIATLEHGLQVVLAHGVDPASEAPPPEPNGELLLRAG